MPPRDTQWRRRLEVARLRTEARRYARAHLDDAAFVAGTVLYWAEGGKTERQLTLSNADPAALRTFIRWVHRHVQPEPRVSLQLFLHADNDESQARAWWSRQLRWPDLYFIKTYLKPAGTGHRKNHLPFGVCKARICRSADGSVLFEGFLDVVARFLAGPSTD